MEEAHASNPSEDDLERMLMLASARPMDGGICDALSDRQNSRKSRRRQDGRSTVMRMGRSPQDKSRQA